MFITDPPILADWGNLYLNIKNLTYMLTGGTYLVDRDDGTNYLQLVENDTFAYMYDSPIYLDGVSDFGSVL